MSEPFQQAAIGHEGVACGLSMEWDVQGSVQALWALLPALAADDVVIGLGAPLLQAAAAPVPGYAAFERLAGGRYTLPATPHALWTFIPGANPGVVFEVAERIKRQLGTAARISESTTLFSYRQGRDLSGYQDGSANPKGDDGWAAALIDSGVFQGGSFALVQRWLHFRDRFAVLPQLERDHTIGRSLDSDQELPDAPPSAHIRRTDQDGLDMPGNMLRRSMPWGDARRHGLQFIAFMNDLGKAQRTMRRMVGAGDGIADAILGHSQAETGAFYFVPPVSGRRLVLPEAQLPKEPAMQRNVEIVETPSLRLKVDASRCVHSRNCVLSRPDVFVPNVVGPWLHPELADTQELAEIARNCPSGAIQVERLDGAAQEQPPMRNVIRLRENGPLAIHGDFIVAGTPQLRATLCRCGQSKNKPYCDGSHVAAGFAASGEATALAEAEPKAMPRQVAVQPIADGPLVMHGALELVSGTGRTISRAAGPTLCRCGQSANKPFCDGSHARVGFRAPE